MPSRRFPDRVDEPEEPALDRAGDLRFVALGDSYTIGTGVRPVDRWPDQLVARLRGQAVPIELAANLGVNGYTSADVIQRELPVLLRLKADLVSLLVGVNDVVQGVPADHYAANLEAILVALRGRLPSSRVVIVSTPDYTVTPAGADHGDPVRQAALIRSFNAILSDASRQHGVAHVDIHDLSLRAATDPSLVAEDGLHPSAAQYALWVDRIAPVVADLVAQLEPGSGTGRP